MSQFKIFKRSGKLIGRKSKLVPKVIGLSFRCYCKHPKNLDTQKITVIILKLEQYRLLQRNWSKRCRLNGKQYRPWLECSSRSSLVWIHIVCPDVSIQKLRFITVIVFLTFQGLMIQGTLPNWPTEWYRTDASWKLLRQWRSADNRAFVHWQF